MDPPKEARAIPVQACSKDSLKCSAVRSEGDEIKLECDSLDLGVQDFDRLAMLGTMVAICCLSTWFFLQEAEKE